MKTKSLNTKQCPAGLYSRIICQVSPFLPNMSKNCCIHQMWTVPPSPEPEDGAKSYPTAKNLLISPIIKVPLTRFKSFAIKSFIFSPSNSNFQVITICNLYLQLQSFLLYHMLNFRRYVHTCHANLTNQCLLNVAYSMTKALNNQSSPKQNFHSLPHSLQCYFENPASINACFPLFHTPFFYKISTHPTPIEIWWLVG